MYNYKQLGKTNSLATSSAERGKFMRTLKDVKIGETVKVKKVGGEGAIKRRIMEVKELNEKYQRILNWDKELPSSAHWVDEKTISLPSRKIRSSWKSRAKIFWIRCAIAMTTTKWQTPIFKRFSN